MYGVEAKMDSLNKGMEAKIDGLKKGVEAKMDGVEGNIDGLEAKMEAIMDIVEAKMDGLGAKMEANMDSVEAKMDGIKAKVDYLKKGMEYLKTYLTKFLQEMLTDGERVVKETHDENKINVNHDFIDSNVGSENHHVPKIDMRKFDDKDPGTWIL